MWATDIGGAASRHGGLATLNGIRADDHWTGMAADAYRNTLPPQLAALTAIKATADELDSTLNDLANSILTYWVSISQATLSLVGGRHHRRPFARRGSKTLSQRFEELSSVNHLQRW
jgi:hypothetical protein